MLNVLIPYIDSYLTEFSKNYGLAERVSNQGGEKIFPGVYKNKSEYLQITLEQGISYHRTNGTVGISNTEENITGCSKGVTIVYPMVLIGCIKRDSECPEFSTDTIASGIYSKLIGIQYPKSFRKLLKAMSIRLTVSGMQTDRVQVWNQEYTGVDDTVDFDYAYFSISYEIEIKGDSSCVSLLCDLPETIPPTCAEIAAIPNADLVCLTQAQLEYIAQHTLYVKPINLVAPSVSGDNSFGSTLTATPGTYLGSGITLTYQWYRSGSEIAGQTALVYNLGVLDTSDTEIYFVETATSVLGVTSTESNRITPNLTPQASAHYQRVIADSGLLPALNDLNTLYQDDHFINDLTFAYDPVVLGYKLAGLKASKLYSVTASGDVVQATTTNQPLLLDASLGRFARVRTDNIEANISALSPVYNSQGPQIMSCQMQKINGAKGYYLSTPPAVTSVSFEYDFTNNALNYVIGGAGFTVSLNPFIPNDLFYVRGYYEGYPLYRIEVSNDGNTWTSVHATNRTQASLTITRMGIGRGTLATNGPSSIYQSRLERGVRNYDLDLDKFSCVANSKLWTNNDGLQFVIAPTTAADDIYPSQIVTETTASFDGVTDKMQSGAISFPAGALSMYLIADWGMIQSGTRYLIDDTGGNISVWTDGTSIFVGTSVNFINAGNKPLGSAMLTFIKNGASSRAQINQGAVVSGNGGNTMPANVIVGGRTATSANNSTLTRHKLYIFNGADSLSESASTQALINSIQNEPLF